MANESNDPVAGLSVTILDLPASTTDAGGIAGPFALGASPPDAVDVTVSGAGIDPSPQIFNKAVNEGAANTFEITVTT